jgi:hypothetical protein
MKNRIETFGVLTLATPNDYLKAIGLALSVRVSNPGVPVAVACGPKLVEVLKPYFDHVVPEEPGLRGFVHKVYLDQYSPFEKTLFLDSDVLVFKPVQPHTNSWKCQTYTACGSFQTGGVSTFGMDRAAVLKKLGMTSLVVIDGAGHGYFCKPACNQVFAEAREITKNYRSWVGDIKYADEDVMNIAMTKLGLEPVLGTDFFSRYLSARPGTMKMDATNAICTFADSITGRQVSPCMMHFAANEAAIPYTYQLFKLFRKFGAPTSGLLKLCLIDLYEREVKLPLATKKGKLLARLSSSRLHRQGVK